MKRNILSILFVLIIIMSFSSAMARESQEVFTSIRGGVYLDFNGDGFCSQDNPSIPNIDLHFEGNDLEVDLFTGANGTYGLVSGGPGIWTVTALPNPNHYVVTSANPRLVEVSTSAGLVRTNIDFCVTRLAGAPARQDAVNGARTKTIEDRGIDVPIPNDYSIEATAARSQASESLLTNPPPPPTNQTVAFVARTPPTPRSEFIDGQPPWLAYLNQFRIMGGLPQLAEDPNLSIGATSHSRYMVVNDQPIAHNESSGNPLFSPEGRQAAINGNIFATSQDQADHEWAINFWVSAPFHLVPMLDPRLNQVGYGQHNQFIGTFHMSAVLDVRTNRETVSTADYPLYFPGPGSETWIVRHSLYEWPDPVTSCKGYSRPLGPPIILQLGDGSGTPRVTGHSVKQGNRLIDSCRFDESTYRNPDRAAQNSGRAILDERDAVVIMPRRPLAVNETYTVEIVADGQTYSWEFSTINKPPEPDGESQ